MTKSAPMRVHKKFRDYVRFEAQRLEISEAAVTRMLMEGMINRKRKGGDPGMGMK